MMITAATAGDSIVLEEERMARSRGMNPLVFRMELAPTILEREFESEEPVVLSCERRGLSVATSAVEQDENSELIRFQENLVFNLLMFRANTFDCSDLIEVSAVTDGKPLPGFDSVMTRIAIRQGTPDGDICDVAAVDLAKYVVGSRGVVEDKIEMQLGSWLSMQVLTTLRRSSKSNIISKNSCCDDEVPPATSHESDLACVSVLATDPLLSEVATALSEAPHASRKVPCNSRLETETDGLHSAMETSVAMDCELNTPRDLIVDSGPSSDTSDAMSAGGADAEEAQSECESEDGDSRQHNRIILSDHPFTSMARVREFSDMYICVCDDIWEESPIVTEVMTPQPLSIWSVQGPEEIDPDEEDDMVDLGDGLMAPKRNIAKLQAAAAGSRTKSGPPAMPGSMSPLQKTIVRPSRARQAITIGLAKPLDLSRCTVLRATQVNLQNQTMIPEPVLSDSDDGSSSQSDEESNSSGSDPPTFKWSRISTLQSHDASNDEAEHGDSASNGSEEISQSLGSPFNLEGNEATSNQQRHERESGESGDTDENLNGVESYGSPEKCTVGDSLANLVEPRSRESNISLPADNRGANTAESTANANPCETAKTSDTRDNPASSESPGSTNGLGSPGNLEEIGCLRRIAELEAESVEVRLILKKSRILLVDLRTERDELQEILREKEEEERLGKEACTENDAERVSELQKEIADDAESMLKLKSELDACAKEKGVVETELAKLKAEMTAESSLRTENERLLRVILSLKQELDREPGVPEVIEELKSTKSELAAERARSESLEAELAKLSSPKASPKKQKGGFFGKSSSSSSKSSKKKTSSSKCNVPSANSPKSIIDET